MCTATTPACVYSVVSDALTASDVLVVVVVADAEVVPVVQDAAGAVDAPVVADAQDAAVKEMRLIDPCCVRCRGFFYS